MRVGGADLNQLKRTIAGFATHPNIFDYALVSLGCEANQPLELAEETGLLQIEDNVPRRPVIIGIQKEGGIQRAVEVGTVEIVKMLKSANESRRTTQPASKLVVGLECGGSDAYSGITANPALGVASDELVRQGGASVLAETPEIYGAEHLLTRRAENQSVADKLIERVQWWEWYAKTLGAELDNNPAPGNKDGGLTTIYEKSLGAVAKGGTMPLSAVYDYAEPISKAGFAFMDTPGYDPISVTGMVAGGCNVICFTTGRGSCFGCVPAPSIKICTNPWTYEQIESDMDINAGAILNGQSISDAGSNIFKQILAVATGNRTKSEMQGIGEEEYAPWIMGPVL